MSSLRGAAVLVLMLAGSAAAVENADLDLKPADFMPDEAVAIRVDELRPGSSGSEVMVTIANRTKRPVTAMAECSLFDAEREDLGTASGPAEVVAAGDQARTSIVSPAEGAKRAYCRIRQAQ